MMYDLEEKINFAVLPVLQGGPHALATCLKQANTEELKDYQKQVLKNAATLADKLSALGCTLFRAAPTTIWSSSI